MAGISSDVRVNIFLTQTFSGPEMLKIWKFKYGKAVRHYSEMAEIHKCQLSNLPAGLLKIVV
jgi:hypothetical protein